MTVAISTPTSPNYSIENIDMETKKERLVNREILCNVSYLVSNLISQDKYCEGLSELFGEEDEDGYLPEVYEYWLVTPWLGKKLKACGELVTEFLDLVIWGRQTTGQSITCDNVIEDIVAQIFAS
jgi:hypothetical protein